MTKRMRTLTAIFAVIALLIAVMAATPRSSTAANLTGGAYTYLINGEEVTFTFDPVVRKDGLLLPVEVFSAFGVKVTGALEKQFSVSKDTVTTTLTVGSTAIALDGQARSVATAPLRLNGRLFLPADLLKEFGVDLVQDGTMIVMKSFLDKVPDVINLSDTDWTAHKNSRGFSVNLKSDAGVYMMGDLALMDQVMVNAANLGITYGMRAKLTSLLQTNTLVYVKLTNLSSRAGGMVTGGAYLVDDQRHQYEVAQVADIGYGLLNSKLVPNAERIGVLVFPKMPAGITSLTMYYDNNQAVVGNFPLIK